MKWREKYLYARTKVEMGPVMSAIYATPTWMLLSAGAICGWFLGDIIPLEGLCK